MYEGLAIDVNKGCFVFFSSEGLLVDLRHSQPWRMWRVIPKQTNQRYELVMFSLASLQSDLFFVFTMKSIDALTAVKALSFKLCHFSFMKCIETLLFSATENQFKALRT